MSLAGLMLLVASTAATVDPEGLLSASPSIVKSAVASSVADVSTPALLPAGSGTVPAQGWDEFHLGRAVALWSAGEIHAAVTELEQIDVSTTSTYPRADRAAFLLAEAYLRLDDRESFAELANIASASTGSPYRQWIRHRQLWLGMASADVPVAHEGATVLGAALLLESGDPQGALRLLEAHDPDDELIVLHLHLQAVAIEAVGRDASELWRRIASRDPASDLDRELVGVAALRSAVLALNTGGDVSAHLERVPAESRHYARALHMEALLAFESGETEEAIALLESLAAERPDYQGTREVLLLLAGQDMDAGRFEEALTRLEAAEATWLAEWEALDLLADPAQIATSWERWEHSEAASGELWIDSGHLEETVAARLAASLDLDESPSDSGSSAWLLRESTRLPSASLDAPTGSELDSLAEVSSRRARLELELVQLEFEIGEWDADSDRNQRYLGLGLAGSAVSVQTLSSAISRLQASLSRADSTLARMDAVETAEQERIALRTGAAIESLRRDILFLTALRHFHADGPAAAVPDDLPDGVPAPRALLDEEERLAGEMIDWTVLFAERVPSLIERSFDQVFTPRAVEDSRLLHGRLLVQHRRAESLWADLDSTLAIDPAWSAAIAQRDSLRADIARVELEESDLRLAIAASVAERGRARLGAEREALDYYLADAAFERAIELTLDPTTSEQVEVLRPARDAALSRLSAFLERYPASFARGETRFRLADLRLLQARDDFQRDMARFLGEEPDAEDMQDRALAPFVDYAPAIELYRAILLEDLDFPHQDAVLFSLGMILSDDGQGEGTLHLRQLVESYPDSPHVQEAWLRIGDERFELRDFAGCIDPFERAAAGADASFSAIALYKLGWAHFEEDRFLAAADGFRRLMDLYTGEGELASSTDLRAEAEEYLVHSLSRAGGADEFAAYFDGLGNRDYERDILASISRLMRGYSLYEEAVGCDRLWLSRYGERGEALAVAQRLIDTYGRWNKPELARAATLELAPAFMEGSSWHLANEDPELRGRGAEFAQKTYRDAAIQSHRAAREGGTTADWAAALGHYEFFLSHWPEHAEAARMHYQAGEAAGELKQFGQAIDHFAVAAADTAEFAADAAWQQVAVADLWYRSETDEEEAGRRAAPAGGYSARADSVARVLLDSGDAYRGRHPHDERNADLLWRQGQLSYAHGWDERAAVHLDALAVDFPRDPRVPLGLRLRGDALYRAEDFKSAGLAYENALAAAQAAGEDSLATSLLPVIPLSHYKHAESLADAGAGADDRAGAARDDSSSAPQDSTTATGEAQAAPYFVEVATRWPEFEHADLALYRAGLGYSSAKDVTSANLAFEQLLRDHPASEHARDSAVRIALGLEEAGRSTEAARAYERFTRLYPEDPDGPEALLKASDLLVLAGDEAGADRMRDQFLDRYPQETDAVMEIRQRRAEAELAKVESGGVSLSKLLASAAGAGGGAASSSSTAAQSASELSAYLALAKQNPELASPQILAKVDFLEAEALLPGYLAMELSQPLPPSIERKQTSLTQIIEAYQECTAHGVAEYTRASAYRIGEALIAFGDALMDSERPAGLSEDDLFAYEEVLEEQSWGFHERGEEAWTELIKQQESTGEDSGGWIAMTRGALWPRVALRFVHRPEMEYPVVAAKPPPRPSSE